MVSAIEPKYYRVRKWRPRGNPTKAARAAFRRGAFCITVAMKMSVRVWPAVTRAHGVLCKENLY